MNREHGITPQQAFEAARVLWPGVAFIRRGRHAWSLKHGDFVDVLIDWPVGVTQWPMPLPEWRDAKFPEDFGKVARFKNGSQHD